ncbi:metalloprotease [Winogradskyella echinorum]|uniref:Metalloprotease n=1 Tax=Winogradskyella echinorum TaxID=538189 RepID=A0ABR6Y2W2_9FLAO|nr:metalloprotease [Winogradskyella echinorum]MBC3847086.1 metalloprotease [Winogradskyella echinorum]MBC5751434.1 metalloprotease [Winogradskyella echinorum]
MIKKLYISFLFLIFGTIAGAQNKIDIIADVDVDTKTITIDQTIIYKNESNDVLSEVYLNDWNNSYSTKSTPLAKRFEEEFSTKFHLAKSEQRGYTIVTSIKNKNDESLEYQNLKAHPDVLKVTLKEPLQPGESYHLKLHYNLVVPDAEFTDYGFTKSGDFELKYWYITPTVYNGKWHYYSNKNLDDLFIPKADISLSITHPLNYKVTSELNDIELKPDAKNKRQTTVLYGDNRIDTYLSLRKFPQFSFIQTDDFIVLSNIYEKGLPPSDKAIITDKITRYLTQHLGKYPHTKLLVSNIDYNKNPLYGLNQLPSFLRPFPDDFQYELKLLKTALKKYIDNVLLLNPRKEHWLSEGLQIYYLAKYVEEHYPDMKLLGTLANVWGIRAFHAADLDFNFQYFLYSMEIARKNKDQPLSTSKDSLTKFNTNIAGKYKAGVGLNYLDKFTDDIDLSQNITEFLTTHQLKPVNVEDFKSFITSKTQKDINWFFTDYVNTRKKIDFKIKSIETTEDSIQLTIRNKRDNSMPISLFKLSNDSVLGKLWVENIKDTKTITLAKDATDKFVLDYDNVIPEFNQRDNHKAVNGSFLNNKPLQFRLFKDIEDPDYNQIFFMPLVEFKNIYDGLTLGTKVYNKTILRKRLNYRFSPQYATKSKSLTGSTSIFYSHNIENKNLFDITYGIFAGYQSFAQDAFFTRIRPSISFSFRDDDDFRSDQIDNITARYVSINRDIGENAVIELDEPDYGVFNLRYTHSNPGIINYSRFNTDFQVADRFSKVSLNYEFRKLTKDNRNVNLRFFAGVFLKNNSDPNSNYFSFALDRPTDYLFDLNYLGRSEAAGLFSQQIIIAEGGFKSKLETPFANQWMTTANFSTSIWRYIQFYGDVGLVKNKFQPAKFVYDSGIRLNLVEDYFEIYLPLYSNLGWEIGQPNYDQRIRFMFTVDPQVLLGLFRRKWY